MKRIEIAGLCLVIAFALSAMVGASVAQAGEYGQCVAKKKGNYTEGNCQAVAEKKGIPDHKGNFEWVPGASPTCVKQAKARFEWTNETCTMHSVKIKVKKGVEKVTLTKKGRYEKEPGPGYTSTTGTATLAIAVCAASTDVGEVTGLKTDVDTVTFTGCNTLGAKCTSEGQVEGTIKTFPLESKLIDHGEKGPDGQEPAPGEVWTEFVGTAASEGYSSLFDCSGKGYFRTKGSVSAVQTGNVNVSSLASTTTFANGAGEQDLITETSELGTEWSGGIGGGPNEFGPFGEFRTKEVTVATNTAAEQSEIKT